MNKVILMGRLTRDPEVRYSQGENGSTAIARYTLAVSRKYKNQEGNYDADFYLASHLERQGSLQRSISRKGSRC